MAPRPTHEPPHVQLHRLAVAARQRGLSFEEFWAEAVRPDKRSQSLVMTNTVDAPAEAVRWPTDQIDRKAWQGAIYSSRDGWRRAYELLPAPPEERALASLSDGLALLDRVAVKVDATESVEADGIGARSALPSAA